MNGFYIVNKDKGMTSFDVCHKLEKSLKLNKCGHTGTLDPNTEGVLVIACNKATKLMPLLNEHDKEYVTTIVFGFLTDTLDITGKVLKEKENIVITNNIIDEAITLLRSETKQIPPIYSSIKVNGRKLYEYARKGEDVLILSRDIKIYDVCRMNSVELVDNRYQVEIKINSSKGFYVRSFARDLGEKIGTYGTMKELLRTKSGQFYISDSFKLNDIIEGRGKLITIEEVFADLPRLDVSDFHAKLVSNGAILDSRQIETDKPFLIYHNNKLISIYEVVDKFKYKPLIIL